MNRLNSVAFAVVSVLHGVSARALVSRSGMSAKFFQGGETNMLRRRCMAGLALLLGLTCVEPGLLARYVLTRQSLKRDEFAKLLFSAFAVS